MTLLEQELLEELEKVFKEQTLIQQEFQNLLVDLEERLISLERCHLTLSQELVGLKEKLRIY